MLKIDDIVVSTGDIQIESISGTLRDDSFILHLDTLEKYAAVESFEDCAVRIFVGEDTRRYGQLVEPNDENVTEIRFPKDWIVHAWAGRYSIQLIGVLRPENDEVEIFDIPFIQVG